MARTLNLKKLRGLSPLAKEMLSKADTLAQSGDVSDARDYLIEQGTTGLSDYDKKVIGKRVVSGLGGYGNEKANLEHAHLSRVYGLRSDSAEEGQEQWEKSEASRGKKFSKLQEYKRSGKPDEVYQEALEYDKKSTDGLWIIRNYANAGRVYARTGQFEKAAEAYGKANEIIEKHGKYITSLGEKDKRIVREGLSDVLAKSEKIKNMHGRGLNAAVAAIIGLLGGLFFLFLGWSTPSVQLSPGTGGVVSSFNWASMIGIILFLVGGLGAYFWVKRKKR